MIDCVVFDLDDTLISEFSYIMSGYKHVSKKLEAKIQIGKREIYTTLVSLYKSDNKLVFNRLLDKYSIEYDQEYIMYLVKCFRNHNPEVKVYSDVFRTLTTLKSKGYKIGLITDGYKESQRKKITSSNLEMFFDEIVITDELGREYWKPHTKPFEVIREKLDTDFDKMVYVGDNPEKDFYVKKIYPITMIRIIRDNDSIYKDDQYRGGIKEDYRINGLEDVFTILGV